MSSEPNRQQSRPLKGEEYRINCTYPIGTSLLETLISLSLLSFFVLTCETTSLTLLQQIQANYYTTVAANQLNNLRAQLQSAGNPSKNLLMDWNQQNKMILPQAQGELSGSVALITWGNHPTTCPQIGLSGCLQVPIGKYTQRISRGGADVVP